MKEPEAGLHPSTLNVNVCQGLPLIPEKVRIGGPHELLCEHTSYPCGFVLHRADPAVCGIDTKCGGSLQSPLPSSGGKKTHRHVCEQDARVRRWD